MKEEKSEHERARQYEIAIQLVCARHCELPLSKMGSKGLFPGVAVPRAFFGTFFRVERKCYPPLGGSPTVRAVVGASIPTRGRDMRLRAHQRAFRSPFGNLRAPKVAEPHRTTNSNPRRSQRVQPRRDCLTRKLLFAAARNGLSVPLCPLGHFILFLLNPHPAAALSFPQR